MRTDYDFKKKTLRCDLKSSINFLDTKMFHQAPKNPKKYFPPIEVYFYHACFQVQIYNLLPRFIIFVTVCKCTNIA